MKSFKSQLYTLSGASRLTCAFFHFSGFCFSKYPPFALWPLLCRSVRLHGIHAATKQGRGKAPLKWHPLAASHTKRKTLEEEEDKRIIHSLLCDLHENGQIWRNKKTAFDGFIKCGNSALNWRMGLLFFWIFCFSFFEVPFGQPMESALLAGIKDA